MEKSNLDNSDMEKCNSGIEERNRKHFEILRGMIVHEDQQVNARLNMLIMIQGWLMVPAAIMISTTSDDPALDIYRLIFVFILAVIGCLVASFFGKSIGAASTVQNSITGTEENAATRLYSFSGDKEKYKNALQAATDQKLDGRIIATKTPNIIYILWTLVSSSYAGLVFKSCMIRYFFTKNHRPFFLPLF